MKKILLLILATLITLPSFARQFSYFDSYDQFLYYTVIDETEKTCELSDCLDDYEKLIIPSLVKDRDDVEYTVISIGDNAFSHSSSINSVEIPSSIITIGAKAFCGTALTSVSIPNSVKSIGKEAFSYCKKMSSVNLPNSITLIEDRTFEYCFNLTSINVPSSVKYIGADAFNGCWSLKSITIPNSVTTIMGGAFSDCRTLKSVNIPNSIISIDNSTFEGCYALTNIHIPISVTSIGSSAFQNSGLISITIPNSVTSIGQYAFYNCKSLTTVKLGNAVNIIGECAFANSALTSVKIPNSVTTLGELAFNNCKDLTTVDIGNSVTSITPRSFEECSGLVSLKIGNSVKTIGSSAFYGCNSLSSLTIPASVSTIERNAFFKCRSLTSLTIPNTVSFIDSYAFAYTGLTSVTLHDGESELKWGDYLDGMYIVFEGVETLDNLYIGRPFIKEVFPRDALTTLTFGNNLSEISGGSWVNCPKLEKLTLGNSIKVIDNFGFYGCSKLVEVVLPPSVESIGEYAFYENSSLVSIAMGHNVKSIGCNAFSGCPASTVAITAQIPPEAPDDVFSDYTGKLYVQGQAAINAYSNVSTCWNKFNCFMMVEPTEMKTTNNRQISGNSGDQLQLNATLMPSDVTLPQIFWHSTNPEIATVDQNGLVTLQIDIPNGASRAGIDNDVEVGCKIIAETLYANGPTVEFTVGFVTTGVEDAVVDYREIDFEVPFEVYDLRGVRVGCKMDSLPTGIYIVRQGGKVKKIAVN